MTLCATLLDMTTVDSRQLAGTIVRDEIARQGLDQDEAAKRARISRSTLHNVFNGEATVKSITLRQIEGALDFPRHFLSYVINADAEKIAAIDGMDGDLRRHVLGALVDLHAHGGDDSVRRRRNNRGA